MENRVSTGLRAFDSELGGGIPTGGVVVFRAPPAAPLELLLGSFVLAEEADSTYVTTLRSSSRIRRSLAACAGGRGDGGDVDEVSIVDLRSRLRETDVSASTVASDIGFDLCLDTDEREAEAAANAVDEDESTPVWVFDSLTDILEVDIDWRVFVSELAVKMESIGGVAYVNLRLPEDTAPSRAEATVLDIASAVFEYHVDRRDETAHSLSALRFLGGQPPSRRIPLEVSERLDVNPDRHM